MKQAFFFLFLIVLLSENCKKEEPQPQPITIAVVFDTTAYREKIKTAQMEGTILPGETLTGQAIAQKIGKE